MTCTRRSGDIWQLRVQTVGSLATAPGELGALRLLVQTSDGVHLGSHVLAVLDYV